MNIPGQVPPGNQPVSLPPGAGGSAVGDRPPLFPPQHGLPPPAPPHGTGHPPILPPPGLPPPSSHPGKPLPIPVDHCPPFQAGGDISPRAAGGESPSHAPQPDQPSPGPGPGDVGVEGNMLMRQSSQDAPSLHGAGGPAAGFPNMPSGHMGPPRAGLLPPPGPRPPLNTGLPPGELTRPPMFGAPHMPPHPDFAGPPEATPPPVVTTNEANISNRPPGPPSSEIRPLGPPGDPLGVNRPPGLPHPPGDLRGISRPPGPPPGEIRPPGPGCPPGDFQGVSRPLGLSPGEIRPPGPGRPPGDFPGVSRPPGAPPGEIRPPGPGRPPGDFPGVSRPPGPPPGEIRPPQRGAPFQPPPFQPMAGHPNGPRPLMKSPPFFPQGPPPGDFPPGDFPLGPGGGGVQEVWFEHSTADGKVYYSHVQTQKTTWERPQNARILPPPVPHPAGPRGAPERAGGRPPLLPPGFPQPPSLPGNPQLVPTRVWSDHQTPEGKVYYYNKVTRQSVWEMPQDYELVMPLPLSFSASGPVKHKAASSEQSAGEAGNAEVGPGGGEEGIAPKADSAARGVGEEERSVEMEVGQSVEENRVSVTPPIPIPAPSPPPLRGGGEGGILGGPLLSNRPPLIPPQGFPPPGTSAPFVGHPPPPPLQATMHPPHTVPPPHLPMAAAPTHASSLDAPIPASVLSLTPALPKREGPRPVASSPVPGTPWSIVWSSDDRTFFFNANSRTSVWTIPSELIGNRDIAKLLENPPGGKKRAGGGGSRDGPDSKRARLSDSDNSDEDEEEEGEGLAIEGVAVVAGELSTGQSAEEKAAEARASKPLEERQKIFKEMLLERGVSAFSTWEKELPKFVFDPRYLLLNQKERKACFQAFIRSRTEEERRERRNQLKEMKEKFRSLLEGARLHPKSSFSEFASKYGKDERFKAVEKMRDREQMFTDFLTELKKGGVKPKDDQKAPSSSAKGKTEKVKQDFFAMLVESRLVLSEDTQWKKVKGSLEHDPRYKAVDSSSKREELFKEYIGGLKESPQETEPRSEQTREERILASLKEREREVQLSRSAQEKEWGRERDQLKKKEAQQQFKALLLDTVKMPQVQWHEAKKGMKRDQRWEVTRLLDHSEREQMFQDHVLELANRRRLQFRRLLEETGQITLDMPWKKARKLIKEDPRYRNFTDSDYKREVEFDKYQADKLVSAKNEFRSLLKETKFITYKSYELVRESERHYKDIIDLLKNDSRYLVLDCFPKDREDILDDFLGDLHRRGPPPPPTATHPGERLKRPPPAPL